MCVRGFVSVRYKYVYVSACVPVCISMCIFVHLCICVCEVVSVCPRMYLFVCENVCTNDFVCVSLSVQLISGKDEVCGMKKKVRCSLMERGREEGKTETAQVPTAASGEAVAGGQGLARGRRQWGWLVV